MAPPARWTQAAAALLGAVTLAGCGISTSTTATEPATTSTAATAPATTATAAPPAATEPATATTTAPPTATTPATTSTPAPPTAIESPDVARLPAVAAAPSGTRLPVPSATHVDRAFLTAVGRDAQSLWTREFATAHIPYTPAGLAFFRTGVRTACGPVSTGVGPFYCPADHGVYVDEPFFDAMATRFGVVGRNAQAYVIAHEWAHHVQGQLGVLGRVHAIDAADPAGANARSVRVELQADCYAGIWMRTAQDRVLLTDADIADALHQAAVVGSDFQQRAANRPVVVEDWTHGSSRQRQEWLLRGLNDGRPAVCDTFAAG